MIDDRKIIYLGFSTIVCIILVIYSQVEVGSLRKELEITHSQLVKKDQDFDRSVKNLDDLTKQVEKREKYWQGVEASYRDSLRQSRKRTAAAIHKYEKIGHTPPPDWSNHQLDSLIRAILWKGVSISGPNILQTKP